MNKIIFDHVSAGFPADETFMRLVDEQRSSLLALCKGMFGEHNVILSGVELIRRGSATPTTEMSAGVVYLHGNILNLEANIFNGNVPASKIMIGVQSPTINATYHSGDSLPAYVEFKAYSVSHFGGGGLAGTQLVPLSSMKRVSLFDEISWSVDTPAETLDVRISPALKVSVKANGGYSICGTVDITPKNPVPRPSSLWLDVCQIPGLPDMDREAMHFNAVAEETMTSRRESVVATLTRANVLQVMISSSAVLLGGSWQGITLYINFNSK